MLIHEEKTKGQNLRLSSLNMVKRLHTTVLSYIQFPNKFLVLCLRILTAKSTPGQKENILLSDEPMWSRISSVDNHRSISWSSEMLM